MQPIILDPLIQKIIGKGNIDRFTVVEIRTAFLALHKDQNIDPVRIRKLVYTQLYKLVKKGWLNTSTSQSRKITTFSKTKLFNLEELKKLSASAEQSESFKIECYKQLNICNTELLECIGSLETYADLWERFPHLQGTFKKRYSITQEKQLNLKGRIKALNLLLETSYEVTN